MQKSSTETPKFIFVSNYLNHHQIPFCNAMYTILQESFAFIQTEKMEELLAKLRKDYLIAFLPTIALFVIALCIGRFTEPMTDLVTAVRIMIVLLLFTLIAFVVSYIALRRARTKITEMEGEKRYEIYAKAYNTRIRSMSILSGLTSVAYALTQDSNDIYLVVIISLLILLYYPSRAFIEKQIGE